MVAGANARSSRSCTDRKGDCPLRYMLVCLPLLLERDLDGDQPYRFGTSAVYFLSILFNRANRVRMWTCKLLSMSPCQI
jgi:hypothetical protein